MTVHDGIFGDTSNFEQRFVPDMERLAEMSSCLKQLGATIVLTSGSFDLIHMGHALYLEEAKRHGSFLIVGVDSDEKVRRRKGPDRPIVPQTERLKMLTHLRPVDLVTLKEPDVPRWALIRAVRPDVLIATAETYTDEEVAELQTDLCGRVVVLDPMATTTTTARLRLLQIHFADKLGAGITEVLPEVIRRILEGKDSDV